MATKGKNQTEVGEGDKHSKNREVRVVTSKVPRRREVEEDGAKKLVDEIVEVTKLLIPVRRVVKERKNMQKFGEVKDVPRG